MTTRRSPFAGLPAAALLAAPGLWLAGWIIMRLGGRRGPGLGWTVAHSVWVVAFLLFGVVAVVLYRLAAPATRVTRPVGAAALIVALLGTGALLVQMVIDLVVGRSAADRAAMGELYDRVFAVPAVELIFFRVAPPLLFAGLLALFVLAATRRSVGLASVALMVIGVVLAAGGRGAPGWYRVAEGLGEICVWLAFVPLARVAAVQCAGAPTTPPGTAASGGGRPTRAETMPG